MSRSTTQHSDIPLVPENSTMPGARFGGFGFGKQGEKAAAERGWKISRPVESLPREFLRPKVCRPSGDDDGHQDTLYEAPSDNPER